MLFLTCQKCFKLFILCECNAHDIHSCSILFVYSFSLKMHVMQRMPFEVVMDMTLMAIVCG
jgi:hypothetical protein